MQNKHKTIRIIAGVFLPLFIGSVFMVMTPLIENYIELNRITLYKNDENVNVIKNLLGFLGSIFFLTLLAIPLCGIQALISSLLMEKMINPKIKSNTLAVLAFSGLGVLSGISLSAFFSFSSDLLSKFVIVGLLVGLIVGTMLRVHFNKHRETTTD